MEKRYRVAIAGILLHLMIGSVYAWSVFTKPIAQATNWSEASVAFAFSIAIFCLGMSAAFMGRLVEKYSPTVTGTIASICYGSGIMLTGYAIQSQQLWMLYVSYGVLGGLGLGAGYVTPVSTIIRWFPDKRGLATGMAIMGFGFAAMLTGPVAQKLMAAFGLVKTFYILGAVYFIVMIISAQFIKKPQPGELPQHINSDAITVKTKSEKTANQALKSPYFYALWLMFFINITCGIGLVSAASPMAQEMTKMNVGLAALMVGIIGIFNGFGRLVWATLSDLIGRPLTFSLIFFVDVVMLGCLLWWHEPIVFVIALCIVMSCYGAGFSVIPAYLSDIFGTKELGTIHGYILTAWAMAGVVGPLVLSFTHQKFHNYQFTLMTFIILESVALLLSIWLQFKLKNNKTKY
ncbi:L-lactate MFS transporter [Ligilactobacillus ceti]|uniref:Major facilitator transporter n=1 Tax=Ligilactobacillus ceti DSM 22408 TaxID=1122146 RepID=A0A0R2KGB1_9LACO|nr:OFA family MFS transporter [Ligilactobacillus ceti]KRN88415.1 major facilitator transporter [Ligilactobacillus ceti DSM 22408]